MIKAADLPKVLSVFPLPGALLLPHARLPLHIFEPRYLAMLEDALKTHERLIGMVQPKSADGVGLHTIGCAGRISHFSEREDGRYMITLSGVSRYRILNEMDGFTPYRRCEVSWEGFASDLNSSAQGTVFDRADFLDLLGRYLSARELNTDWSTLKDAGDELLINSLSMMLEFGVEGRQALLEAPTLSARHEILVTLIEFALRGGATEETMQ